MNATLESIQSQMDSIGNCTTDGVVLFINHWGRVCAKISCRKGTIAGWGDDVQTALNNLHSELTELENQTLQIP